MMNHTDTGIEPVDILLVEDNAGDVELTRQGFLASRFANNLHVVRNGEEAIAFLNRQEPYADSPRPGLILLDLNLPRKDGHEVLAEIKSDEGLKDIPVIVLTSSEAEQDIIKTYRLHANAFITKPVDFEHFVEAVQTIAQHWFTLVTLPPARPHVNNVDAE
jgi:CheY-like chemotaxis protein